MHYLYFLWSEKLQRVYIGETADVLKRLAYHNQGRQRFTKKGISWYVVAFIPFNFRSEALREERRLKKMKNRKYLKKYILERGKKFTSGG
jgi:putative endonuclease